MGEVKIDMRFNKVWIQLKLTICPAFFVQIYGSTMYYFRCCSSIIEGSKATIFLAFQTNEVMDNILRPTKAKGEELEYLFGPE